MLVTVVLSVRVVGWIRDKGGLPERTAFQRMARAANGRLVLSFVKQRALKWPEADRGGRFVVRSLPHAELLVCHGHMRLCVWVRPVCDEVPHELLDAARLAFEKKSQLKLAWRSAISSTTHPGP